MIYDGKKQFLQRTLQSDIESILTLQIKNKILQSFIFKTDKRIKYNRIK